MRMPNDVILAEKVPDIDLILGGHDHVFDVKKINGINVIKSGTDFRQFSKITLNFGGPKVIVDVEEVNITKDVAEDTTLKAKLDEYTGKFMLTSNQIKSK